MNNIKSSADVFAIVSSPLKDEIQECLGVITMNSANDVIGLHWMCKGSDTAVQMPVKLILRQALMDVACGIVLVHNHPSGHVQPSAADIKQTEKLKSACDLMDISLMDHVIVGGDKWYSFADEEEHSI